MHCRIHLGFPHVLLEISSCYLVSFSLLGIFIKLGAICAEFVILICSGVSVYLDVLQQFFFVMSGRGNLWVLIID